MNWFRRTDKREEGRSTRDDRPSSVVHHPSSLVPRPSSLNYFLLLFFALFTGIVLMKAGILQATGSGTALQAGWSGGADGGAPGTLTGWTMTLLMLTVIGAMRKVGMFEAGISGCWVNDYVASSLTGGGLCKATPVIWRRIPRRRLSFPFSVASFGGMEKNAEYNQTYPQDTQEYSNGERKFFKEIARQTDSEYSFTQISHNFGGEFSSRGVNNRLHRFNDNMGSKCCQAQYLAGARP